jgi:hypothetical protein
MSKRRVLIGIAVATCLFLLWIVTLGMHSAYFVRAYCEPNTFGETLDVYVFLDANSSTSGIPYLFTHYSDNPPYSLEVAVTIDESISAKTSELIEFKAVFENGTVIDLLDETVPESVEFHEFQAYPHDIEPGKSYQRCTFEFPHSISKRGDFNMIIRGRVNDQAKTEFERELRMDYSREHEWISGWMLYIIGPSV